MTHSLDHLNICRSAGVKLVCPTGRQHLTSHGGMRWVASWSGAAMPPRCVISPLSAFLGCKCKENQAHRMRRGMADSCDNNMGRSRT